MHRISRSFSFVSFLCLLAQPGTTQEKPEELMCVDPLMSKAEEPMSLMPSMQFVPVQHQCTTNCAASEKVGDERDGHTHKVCQCDAATKGRGCENGNQTIEVMPNCVNREHCKKHCCHCCRQP
jgi:hypothetical protein